MLSYGDGVGEGYVGCGERGSGDGCAGSYPRETPPLLALRRLMQEMVAVREAMFSINGKVEKMHQLVTLVALGLRVHKQRVQRLERKLKGVEWTLMSCGAVKDSGKSKSKAKGRDKDKARRLRDASDKRERERQRGVAEAAVQATGPRASRARAWSWAHAPHTRSLSSTRAPTTTTTTIATTTPTGSSTPERAAGATRRPCSSRSWDSRPASGEESRWRLRPRLHGSSRWQRAPGAARREQQGGRAALGRRLLQEVEDGNVQGVLQLLDLGADANFSSARRWVPLHRAARKANADVLSMLLLWGANVHARTSYGFTALHIAAYNDPSGRCVAVLLEAGSDVHSRNKSGRTPLHSAAECGNEAAVRALLAAGARATEQDDGGRTPYDAAKTEAVRRLLAPD